MEAEIEPIDPPSVLSPAPIDQLDFPTPAEQIDSPSVLIEQTMDNQIELRDSSASLEHIIYPSILIEEIKSPVVDQQDSSAPIDDSPSVIPFAKTPKILKGPIPKVGSEHRTLRGHKLKPTRVAVFFGLSFERESDMVRFYRCLQNKNIFVTFRISFSPGAH